MFVLITFKTELSSSKWESYGKRDSYIIDTLGPLSRLLFLSCQSSNERGTINRSTPQQLIEITIVREHKDAVDFTPFRKSFKKKSDLPYKIL